MNYLLKKNLSLTYQQSLNPQSINKAQKFKPLISVNSFTSINFPLGLQHLHIISRA